MSVHYRLRYKQVDTHSSYGVALPSGRTRGTTLFSFMTLNQSFLIYQRGFMSWRLMPTPMRNKKTHNSSEKASANPCSDAIITHNQIRTDLNRHRTLNHIKGNSMCMALHCSQSTLFSPFPSLFPLTSRLLPISHHHHCLSILNASDLKKPLPVALLRLIP